MKLYEPKNRAGKFEAVYDGATGQIQYRLTDSESSGETPALPLYAQFANACRVSQFLDLVQRYGGFSGDSDDCYGIDDADEWSLFCEAIYRLSCVRAYGLGRAHKKDIESFVSFSLDEPLLATLLLPVGTSFTVDESELRIPENYMPELPETARVYCEQILDGYLLIRIQSFAQNKLNEMQAAETLAQWAANLLLVNEQKKVGFNAYVFQGNEPVFLQTTLKLRILISFASAATREYPGICAACGRVFSSFRQRNGQREYCRNEQGSTKNSSCKDAYHNEKKRLAQQTPYSKELDLLARRSAKNEKRPLLPTKTLQEVNELIIAEQRASSLSGGNHANHR